MADFALKKQHYIDEIKRIAKESYNDEQKKLAIDILNNSTESNIDNIYTFITQRVKTGFVFDAAPEVAHNCISLCERDNKRSFGNESGIHHKLIIGENYDALKNLVATYTKNGHGLIDVIYIDPPYNTEKTREDGNDYKTEVKSEKFIYRDKFSRTGWLNMMRERLVLARKLLSETGVIFISIDDSEQAYLKVLCDEIFGENNFIGMLPRLTSAQRPAQEPYFAITNDYILVYTKQKAFGFNHIIKRDLTNVKQDNIGNYIEGDTSPILASSTQGYSVGGDYDVVFNGKKYKPVDSDGNRRRWLWSEERMKVAIDLGLIVETSSTLRVKNYINKEFQVGTNIMVDKDPLLILTTKDLMTSDYVNNLGTSCLKALGLNKVFDFPKPVELIKKLISLHPNKNSIVLDFFGGSGTTMQAVMELNATDSGNRQCILVTNNENNIADNVTYERIYRVINGVGTHGEKFDWTFAQDKPYLSDNYVDVFNVNSYELQIDDFEKSAELLDKAKLEFQRLNPNYEFHDFDIYNQLASLKPYKKN